MFPLGYTIHVAMHLSKGFALPDITPDLLEFCGWSEGDTRVIPQRHRNAKGDFVSGVKHWAYQVNRGADPAPPSWVDSWSGGGPVVLCMKPSMEGASKKWEFESALRAHLTDAGIAFVDAPNTGPLKDLLEVLQKASVVIGVDTGPTHIASYVGAPTVGLYTTTRADYYGLQGPDSYSLQNPTLADVLACKAFVDATADV